MKQKIWTIVAYAVGAIVFVAVWVGIRLLFAHAN
jgi:hypothetical protein